MIKKLVVFKPWHQFRHFLISFAGGLELSNPKSALGRCGSLLSLWDPPRRAGEHLLGFSWLRLAGISDTPGFFSDPTLGGLILGVRKGPLSWEGGWYAGKKKKNAQLHPRLENEGN